MTTVASDKAHQLREYGLRTSNQLRDASRHIDPINRNEILALSARIDYCNLHQNTWTATDLHNQETGELFEGFGRYWHCSSKLCSYCLRLNSRRNRITLKTAIAAQKLHVAEHYRFITLTLPNLGLDIPITREIVNRAWSLLRKRSLFVRSVVGGAKAEEFTVTSTGYHYHIHLLARTKSIRSNDLRRDWTECVAVAFREHNIEFVAPTSDGLLIVNIKIVHNLKQVSNEVCKYVTKASTWWKIPTDALIEIALIPRWSRMFEIFGSFRDIDTVKLDKTLNDGFDERPEKNLFEDNDEPLQRRNYWRTLIRQMSLKKYLARLHFEVNDTIRRRTPIVQLKFPFATINALDSG
jgi:Replication protein